MLIGPFLGLPLLPAQVLWINLLTHGPVGVAMGGELAAPDVLRRPPRDPATEVLDRALVVELVRDGLVLGAVCLAVAVAVASAGADGPRQTQLFIALAVGQLALALALRPAGAWSNDRGEGLPWLPVAVAANLVLLAAAVLLPGLSDLLGPERISLAETAFAVGPALVPAALVLVLQAIRAGR